MLVRKRSNHSSQTVAYSVPEVLCDLIEFSARTIRTLFLLLLTLLVPLLIGQDWEVILFIGFPPPLLTRILIYHALLLPLFSPLPS